MRMVVDFPAPLGPRNPKNEPRGTSRSTPLTAATEPYDFLRSRTRIAAEDISSSVLSNAGDPVAGPSGLNAGGKARNGPGPPTLRRLLREDQDVLPRQGLNHAL